MLAALQKPLNPLFLKKYAFPSPFSKGSVSFGTLLLTKTFFFYSSEECGKKKNAICEAVHVSIPVLGLYLNQTELAL